MREQIKERKMNYLWYDHQIKEPESNDSDCNLMKCGSCFWDKETWAFSIFPMI